MEQTEAKYLVRGYCGEPESGYDCEAPEDNLSDAYARARYMMSEEYMHVVESASPVSYVEIIRTKTGTVVATF